MDLRTDQYRFMDPRYVVYMLSAGLDPAPRTPALKEELLKFGEWYKGILDVGANLLRMGLAKAEILVFVSLVVKTGASRRLIMQVLNTTVMLVRQGRLGREVIQRCVYNSAGIGKKLGALNSKAGAALIFVVVLQVGFHLQRGDYAKAIAEIGKAALCGLLAPMALIDLVDTMLGFALPEQWANFPPVRVIRAMNPAQCSALIIENMSILTYVFCMARKNNWKQVTVGIDKMCKSFETSPAGIYSYLARDTAMLMDEYVLPAGVSKFEIFGASIRNLADNARANPYSY